MNKIFGRTSHGLPIYLLIFALTVGCSAPRYMNIPEIKEESSVKIYLTDGKVYEGLITQRAGGEITLVSEKDHEPYVLQVNDVRRLEKSDNNYDFLAYPISDAEIDKYKSNRNSWGYAIGGAFVGGLVGIAIALPLWYSDAGVPPYFTGGIGAIAGSIFFGYKGIQKDREVAVETVRYLREKERELEKQKADEEKQLKEIRKKTDELKKKLDDKEEG
jgi:hypothetical protein